MTELKFANVDFSALQIEITVRSSLLDDIEEKNMLAKMTYSIVPTRAGTVTDALTALHIFKGLFQGTTTINGIAVKSEDTDYIFRQEQMEDALQFWNTAKAIEEKIGVSFMPDAEFPEEDARFFTELKLCLLEEKSICWEHPFEHFHVGNIHLEKEISFEDFINKEEISYRFLEGPISATLLGAEFELYSLTEMVGFVMTNVEWDNDKKTSGEIYIVDASEKAWRLIRKYITKEEAKIQKEISNNIA